MLRPVESSFVTKISLSPVLAGNAAVRVGKFDELVVPAMYTLLDESTATLLAKSSYANVYLVQQNSLGGIVIDLVSLLRLDPDVVAADPNLYAGPLQASGATQLHSTWVSAVSATTA